MRTRSIDEIRLLTKVSRLYYDDGLKQETIGELLHLSKSKVSRLMKQARDEGIVKIVVISPPGIYSEIENQLETKYRIQEAIVTDVRNPESPEMLSRDLGSAASSYLMRVIGLDEIIGIAWGHTISGMVEALEPGSYPNVKVVQLTGGIGKPESETYATELCHRMARVLSCKLALLPAPGIVKDKRLREVYLADHQIQTVLSLFSKITLAFVGIGAPTSHTIIERDSSILTKSDLDDVTLRGAVGDIALRFFDQNGQFMETELNDFVIGIDLEQLRKIPLLVGVAGGASKVKAIRSALLGRLVNVLITDRITAISLLENN
jgi:DNA-binding transcriptional regulator LsrR (DeoR family)